MKLYRIGELAKAAGVSERTIDYYTKLGLISPETRTHKNYRLYSLETLNRLERINQWKQEKYTLEEIRARLDELTDISEEQVSEKLTSLELHLQQLEREVKELEPLISQLKPGQANKVYTHIMPSSLACIEALRLLMNHGPFT
ncbi:transcriptional regulator [Paenibacillus yonginensis]|uniref:Transcriptional regulator n=1 Tax=Paenibacillus yonginensis TaxID=1462996 RepID=A0A1B1MXD7_9BACL|nr:MerR family transcriptional regulator [Paenibacillus yonginensis]ANS73844.1 transcriptional regulator [Paenibacillus yonginensis]